MEKIRECLFKALRDDSVVTVGIRALLGHPATPWGVHHMSMPESPDFSTLGYLTYYLLAQPPGGGKESPDSRLREAVFSVTAWSESADTVDKVLRRAENVLVNARKVTVPTREAGVHGVDFDGSGPMLFDDDYKVFYRAVQFRVKYRDDITV